MGVDGVLTQTQPIGQAVMIVVGTAIAVDTIVINILPAIHLAAA
jgi:hypothetical protein